MYFISFKILKLRIKKVFLFFCTLELIYKIILSFIAPELAIRIIPLEL